MALHAIDREIEAVRHVFSDTGHEHPETYRYVDYLETVIGPIQRVKADFSEAIARKRKRVEETWYELLQQESTGEWKWDGPLEPCPEGEDPGRWLKLARPWNTLRNSAEPQPPVPTDRRSWQIKNTAAGRWTWFPAYPPLTAEESRKAVAETLAVLHPTGNAFLDLCVYKGRFPSTRARFCSQELKHEPMWFQAVEPLLEEGHSVISWQGVRAEESPSRAKLQETEQSAPNVRIYRPLLRWTWHEVFAIHRRHGVRWNPLYEMGASRVGCMPCIHCRKSELREIALRWPEQLARVAEWEARVSAASRFVSCAFFSSDKIPGDHHGRRDVNIPGIHEVAAWAKTGHGRTGMDDLFMEETEELPMCSSLYGLCE